MPTYRDTVVNITAPATVVDWTAKVVYDELAADQSGEVFTQHLAEACDAHQHADREVIGTAVKGLRNIGHCITTHPARHMSWYTLHTDPTAIAEHHVRIAQTQYSERISWVRSMASAAANPAAPPSLKAMYAEGQMQAIGLGLLLGKSPADVVTDCDVLATPSAAAQLSLTTP